MTACHPTSAAKPHAALDKAHRSTLAKEPKIGELWKGRVHLDFYRYRHEAQMAINLHGSGVIEIRPRKLRPFWANAHPATNATA